MNPQALRASVRKDQEKAVADCAFFFTCRSVDRSYRYLTSGPVTIKTLRRLKKTGPQTRKKLRESKKQLKRFIDGLHQIVMQPWKKKTQKNLAKRSRVRLWKYKLKIPSERHNEKTAETWANEFRTADHSKNGPNSGKKTPHCCLRCRLAGMRSPPRDLASERKKSRFGNTYCYIMLHDVTINYTCDQLLSSTLPRSVPTSLPTSKPLRNHAGWVIHDQLCARSILAWYGHNSGEIHNGSCR